MSTPAASTLAPLRPLDQLRLAKDILRHEGGALLALAERLSGEFCDAADLLFACRGNVIVTGMGKAGLVGKKITATLASTGTRSHFVHPGEAVHGDLGRIGGDDVVLALSHSGETEELTRILPSLATAAAPIVAITGQPQSTLARAAAVTLNLGPLVEACPYGLAPSTSTTAMIALGDALALVVSRMRSFGPDDFARFHPGGSLGKKLAKVDDVMRPLRDCRVARDDLTVRQVLVDVSRPGRRTGAIMLVDGGGRLTGLFTDSDLARLFERRRDAAIDGPVAEVMTREPATIVAGAPLSVAVELLSNRKISELPVVDAAGRALGLIDITDVVQPAANDADAAPPTVPFPTPRRGRSRP